MIISDMPGITLCIEAASGEDLLTQLEKISPDVILLDIEMKNINGIETMKRLLERSLTQR
jgi:chemotaxis response regulator CheB